jgi:ABC-2 type transport system permease protein
VSVRSDLGSAVRAYPALLQAGFAAAIAYRAEFLIWMFSTNMPLVMLALWAAVARSGPIAGYTARGFTAYYLVTLLVRLLTGCWVVWALTMEIRGGTLAMRLLRPIHPLLAYSAENLSAVPLRLVVSAPVIAILVFTARGELTGDWLAWALVVPSLLGAFLITFLVQVLVGTLALYAESAAGLFMVWLNISAVLSGYLIPLDLFPAAVRGAADVLPFRFTLSYTVELVLGRLGHAEALRLLLGQWAYVLGFGVAALAAWRSGLRRFGAFGG